jgi:hypothetical protein
VSNSRTAITCSVSRFLSSIDASVPAAIVSFMNRSWFRIDEYMPCIDPAGASASRSSVIWRARSIKAGSSEGKGVVATCRRYRVAPAAPPNPRLATPDAQPALSCDATMSTTALPRLLTLALALAPIAACGKTSRNDAPSAGTTAPSAPTSSSSSAAVAPPPPPPSAAPSSTSSATPAERFTANLASAKQEITSWKCSPNQPIQLKPHRASLLTFRCPDDTDLVPFDARSNGGFLLIDGVADGYAIGRGTVDTNIVKRQDEGLLHGVRDGKTDALIMEYTIWHLSAVPGGYRLGTQMPYSSVFAIVDGAWVQEKTVPAHPADGLRFGRDPVPVFPTDGSSVKLCFNAACETTTPYPLAERFESWDGERYATDLEELAPVYRARLKAARAFLAVRMPTAAASASVMPSSSAPPAASAAPSASTSASAAAPAKAAPTDTRYDDVGTCPLGVLRAAAEVFAYSRLLSETPEESARVADLAAALVPAGACGMPKMEDVPPWAKLRDELEKSWKPGALSRKRATK